jgi:hypothetical protein
MEEKEPVGKVGLQKESSVLRSLSEIEEPLG